MIAHPMEFAVGIDRHCVYGEADVCRYSALTAPLDSNREYAAKYPARAPTTWAITKGATSCGRMPEKVPVRDRATVMAGLAKDVDAVNQYAAPIQPATIQGASCLRLDPRMTSSSPNVATASDSHWAGPERAWRDDCKRGSSNIACASSAPAQHPTTWTSAYNPASGHGIALRNA